MTIIENNFKLSNEINADLLLTGEVKKLTTAYILSFKLYSREKDLVISENLFTYKSLQFKDEIKSDQNKENKDDDKKDKENITTFTVQ